MNTLALETKRLTLRRMQVADCERMVQYLGDFEVSSKLARVPHPYPPEHAREILSKQDKIAAQGILAFTIDDGTGLVGGINARPFEDGHYVGYWLGKPYWGKGYMSEALAAVLHHLFVTLSTPKVRSTVFLENAASAGLLSKFGYELLGQSEDPCAARGGRIFPVRVFELSRERYLYIMQNAEGQEEVRL
ncbi:N-acetyltransferase [Rhodobacteraceae bacterium RKSG542]|uniref:GNAT family N-acetyltransferase n=1 Tax=Pseudovibrio flavus TaxID=2529854 RepID=UPI0012BBB90F|nr:GNAT family N-acetyltransferase [Pseudovibrio flavus]MTI17757.1 N-acetyltransferase [Pseudovibrio flavus]